MIPEFVEDLPSCYRGAEIFVFPSAYEGFGFPPLEAMASGTPVVSSNATSLPEIIGQGGVLLPPDDLKGWVQMIDKILSDRDYRNNLIREGLSQASRFSWEETARKTISIYNELYLQNNMK